MYSELGVSSCEAENDGSRDAEQWRQSQPTLSSSKLFTSDTTTAILQQNYSKTTAILQQYNDQTNEESLAITTNSGQT